MGRDLNLQRVAVARFGRFLSTCSPRHWSASTKLSHRNTGTMATTTSLKNSRFLADPNPPLCSLNIKPAFDLLSDQEKAYAHWYVPRAGLRFLHRSTR